MKISAARSLLLILASVSAAAAEDEIHFRLISLPSKDVPEVRKILADRVKGADIQTFRTLRKDPGVKEIGGSQGHDVTWDDKPSGWSTLIGGIGRNPGRSTELKVRLNHRLADGVYSQSFNSFFELPTSPDRMEYVSFTGDCRYVPIVRRKWLEKTTWITGKDAWMIWQYVDTTGSTDRDAGAETQAAALREKAFSADFLFFKATPSDIAQLAKSGPDTRAKAVEWLQGRTPAWKELRVTQEVGNGNCFTISAEGKLTDRGDHEEADENSLTLETTSSRTDGTLSINLAVTVDDGHTGNSAPTEKKVLEKVTTQWNFALLESLGKVNVVAYREVVGE